MPGLYRPPLELTRIMHHEEEDDYDIDEDDLRDPLDHVSCIGLRKKCLVRSKCNKVLTDFRRLCRENKKKNVCVTDDRWVQYRHSLNVYIFTLVYPTTIAVF